MKMAVRLSRYKQLLLVMMCLALLSACGSGGGNDLSSPALSLDALPSSTFEREKDLKGTVEAGADVVVTVNTSAEVGAVTNEDGIWSCTISDLAVGSNVVTVRAADGDGNSNSLQLVLAYDILKIDQVDTVTADTAPTVYGRVASGSITKVSLNGTDLDPLPVAMPGDGTFTLPLTGLVAGNNTVKITAEDASAVPLTQTISQTIVQDDNAVSLTVTQPTIIPGQNELTLTGTVGAGGEVSVVVAPEATVGTVSYPTTTSWSVDISDLEERDSILTVSAAQEGKPTAVTTTRVTVASLPEVASTDPADGDLNVSPEAVVTATFSEAVVGTTVNTGTFLLKAGGVTPIAGTVSYNAADKTATFTPNATLDSGLHTATIDGVTDPDGNIVFESWNFTVQ